ncbi:MAG: hypothetical protein DVB31_01400 [Verrucomicrobia bacterium]|nr:MAG: hypothetical protein DVB31_01400 [Verrucomicrobiota bacterium]
MLRLLWFLLAAVSLATLFCLLPAWGMEIAWTGHFLEPHRIAADPAGLVVHLAFVALLPFLIVGSVAPLLPDKAIRPALFGGLAMFALWLAAAVAPRSWVSAAPMDRQTVREHAEAVSRVRTGTIPSDERISDGEIVWYEKRWGTDSGAIIGFTLIPCLSLAVDWCVRRREAATRMAR